MNRNVLRTSVVTGCSFPWHACGCLGHQGWRTGCCWRKQQCSLLHPWQIETAIGWRLAQASCGEEGEASGVSSGIFGTNALEMVIWEWPSCRGPGSSSRGKDWAPQSTCLRFSVPCHRKKRQVIFWHSFNISPKIVLLSLGEVTQSLVAQGTRQSFTPWVYGLDLLHWVEVHTRHLPGASLGCYWFFSICMWFVCIWYAYVTLYLSVLRYCFNVQGWLGGRPVFLCLILCLCRLTHVYPTPGWLRQPLWKYTHPSPSTSAVTSERTLIPSAPMFISVLPTFTCFTFNLQSANRDSVVCHGKSLTLVRNACEAASSPPTDLC